MAESAPEAALFNSPEVLTAEEEQSLLQPAAAADCIWGFNQLQPWSHTHTTSITHSLNLYHYRCIAIRLGRVSFNANILFRLCVCPAFWLLSANRAVFSDAVREGYCKASMAKVEDVCCSSSGWRRTVALLDD